jgi:class 3 adenylate cyclase
MNVFDGASAAARHAQKFQIGFVEMKGPSQGTGLSLSHTREHRKESTDRQVTVMFSDLVGSTALSARIKRKRRLGSSYAPHMRAHWLTANPLTLSGSQ